MVWGGRVALATGLPSVWSRCPLDPAVALATQSSRPRRGIRTRRPRRIAGSVPFATSSRASDCPIPRSTAASETLTSNCSRSSMPETRPKVQAVNGMPDSDPILGLATVNVTPMLVSASSRRSSKRLSMSTRRAFAATDPISGWMRKVSVPGGWAPVPSALSDSSEKRASQVQWPDALTNFSKARWAAKKCNSDCGYALHTSPGRARVI